MKGRPAVILVRPTEEGNVGAVARAMANTGLERLILIEPAVRIAAVARARATGGASILDAATRRDSLTEALAPFRQVVGTSSHRARSPRAETVEPRELAGRLAGGDGGETALVFGPERSGLTTEELALCGTIVRIPTASELPTLNLAQAVLIIAYELFMGRESVKSDSDAPPPAKAADVEALIAQVDATLRTIGFARDSTYGGVLLDLRRLAARSGLSDREIAILRGLCRRFDNALARRE